MNHRKHIYSTLSLKHFYCHYTLFFIFVAVKFVCCVGEGWAVGEVLLYSTCQCNTFKLHFVVVVVFANRIICTCKVGVAQSNKFSFFLLLLYNMVF